MVSSFRPSGPVMARACHSAKLVVARRVAPCAYVACVTARIIQLHPRATHARAFDLVVTLTAITPPIWRRLRIASDFTLRDLHHVLQFAFGWNDSHLHEFQIGETHYGFPEPDGGPARQPLDERKFR